MKLEDDERDYQLLQTNLNERDGLDGMQLGMILNKFLRFISREAPDGISTKVVADIRFRIEEQGLDPDIVSDVIRDEQ